MAAESESVVAKVDSSRRPEADADAIANECEKLNANANEKENEKENENATQTLFGRCPHASERPKSGRARARSARRLSNGANKATDWQNFLYAFSGARRKRSQSARATLCANRELRRCVELRCVAFRFVASLASGEAGDARTKSMLFWPPVPLLLSRARAERPMGARRAPTAVAGAY